MTPKMPFNLSFGGAESSRPDQPQVEGVSIELAREIAPQELQKLAEAIQLVRQTQGVQAEFENYHGQQAA